MANTYQMLFELNAALGGGFNAAFSQGSQQIENLRTQLDALNSAGNASDVLGGISATLETVGAVKALETTYETLRDCAQASIEFESAMTGVSKTTDMSAAELEAMSDAVMKLSTEIPVTTTDLANVMEVAGQLGISKDNLLDFSTVMSQLATATTMTADEAATMLAQFANITQMNPGQYKNLASAVVDLGNNYATTEQKIIDMGQGIAAAGSLAGMSEADMMGLSAAVTSLGIETAAGSTSMSKLISELNTAVETGNGLDQFASVAGMTASQFADAWGNDAANALASFVTGLNDVERNGASASVILGDLGIKEARMQRMVLSLAGSGDLMSNAIRTANDAFRENVALTNEAEKRYATTESRLTMLQNAANNVKIAVGDALTPMIADTADGLTKLIEPLAEFIETNPEVVQGLTAFVGILGGATAVIGGFTAAAKLAAAASAIFGAAIPGVGVIMGAAAGVGALVTGIGLLKDAYDDAHPSFYELDEQFDSLNERVKEQQGIIDLVDTYRTLTNEADNLQQLMNKGYDVEVRVTGTVDGVDKLRPDDFVDSTTVTLTAEQANLLAANSFLDGAVVSLSAVQAEFLKAQGFLEDDTVFLDPEEKEKIDAGEFVDGTQVYLTAEMANALAAEGYFTDGTTVDLTAEKANELKASEFMADQEIILTGEAGNTLTAADFGISDQTLIYLAKMDEASYEAVAARAQELRTQMEQAEEEISTAESSLSTMKDEYSALEEQISGTKNRKQKAALTEQLEELGKAIEDQSGNVEDLKGKYGELESEFNTASSAAEELAGKKLELAEVTQALRDSSDGMITAAAGETEALNREIDALEALAQARKNKYSADALDTVKKQSSQYIQAVSEMEEASTKLGKANAQADTAKAFIASGNAAEYVRGEFEGIVEAVQAYDGSWLQDTTEEAATLRSRFFDLQDTINALSGNNYDFSGNGLAGMGATIDTLSFDIWEIESGLNKATSAAIEYGDAMKDNSQIQQEYLQNLVDGIIQGSLKEEELQTVLEEAYSGYQNGGELVAETMQKVKEGVEAARAAVDGSGSQAQTEAETAVDACGRIISQIDALSAAYDKARESALNSLGARFSLFGEVEKGVDALSTEEMTKNLAAQEQYWERYNENLQAVVDKGLSQEIAQQLADGTAESAATLAALASSSEEEIQKINNSFAEVEASRNVLASTIADMETQFTAGMDKLTEELTSTIAEMEQGSEAAAAASTTIQAYVDEIARYVGPAQAKAQAIADAVNAALASIQTDIEINISANTNGLTSGKTPSMAVTKRRNAIGTDYAAEGVTLVGEEGPELVYMHGGEKVLTAHETVNALSGGGRESGSYAIAFHNTYNVSGGNASEIRKVLEEHDADLRGQLESLIQEIRTDELRTRIS